MGYDFLPVTCVFFLYAGFRAFAEEVSLPVTEEGHSLTMNTGLNITPQQRIRWFYYDTRIAYINAGQSKICSDAECPETFRDRLNLDPQTGSLTITDTRTTDSGLYSLQIISNTFTTDKIFRVSVIGPSGDERDMFVMEGDSVTLYPDVKTNQNDRIKWFHEDIRIAQTIVGQSSMNLDAECPESFKGRLTLESQTGSLTITNINIAHDGQYKLQIINSTSSCEKIFSIAVRGVSLSERDELKSVKEGQSVTLHSGVRREANNFMTWFFNDFPIAEINRDQSETCTNEKCKESFRDRLKLDQTGSLTITDTRTTDTGEYKLKKSSSRFRIVTSFTVTVTDSGSSSGVVVVVVAVAAAAAVILLIAAVVYCVMRQRRDKKEGVSDTDQTVGLMQTPNGPSHISGSSPVDGSSRVDVDGSLHTIILMLPMSDFILTRAIYLLNPAPGR